jgi:integration host factor subunit alpha
MLPGGQCASPNCGRGRSYASSYRSLSPSADLYHAIYQKIGLSRTQSATLVELVLKEITDCLERGETVKLSSFGLFVVRKKGQRMGRNPKTGEEAPISPRRVVVFKPSEVLKQRIDAPRSHIDGTRNKEGIGGDTSQ